MLKEEERNEEGVEKVNKERGRKKNRGKEEKNIKNFVRERRRIMKNGRKR